MDVIGCCLAIGPEDGRVAEAESFDVEWYSQPEVDSSEAGSAADQHEINCGIHDIYWFDDGGKRSPCLPA